MTQDNNIIHQLGQFQSEWSRMDLTAKIGYVVSKQRELNLWANNLVHNRMLRGYFTPEEKAAVQLLQDVQNELDRHKAEVNRDIYNELSKELLKAIMYSG